MGELARPANQLSAVGVPLGPLPRPDRPPQDWPVGMIGIWTWALGDLPDNFRRLDGSTLPANEFPDLAALAGVASGGTITLPDLDGRFPLGVDGADATHDAVRETGGAKTHTLTTAEMPSHDHAPGAGSFLRQDVGGGASLALAAGLTFSTTALTAAAGGGTAHTNMPPFMAVYFVIRVK